MVTRVSACADRDGVAQNFGAWTKATECTVRSSVLVRLVLGELLAVGVLEVDREVVVGRPAIAAELTTIRQSAGIVLAGAVVASRCTREAAHGLGAIRLPP